MDLPHLNDQALLGNFYMAAHDPIDNHMARAINIKDYLEKDFEQKFEFYRDRGLKGIIPSAEAHYEAMTPNTNKIAALGLAFEVAFVTFEYAQEEIVAVKPKDLNKLQNFKIIREGTEIAFMTEDMQKNYPLIEGNIYRANIGYANDKTDEDTFISGDVIPYPIIISEPYSLSPPTK